MKKTSKKILTTRELLLSLHGCELDNAIVLTDGKNLFKLVAHGNEVNVVSGSFNADILKITPLTNDETEKLFNRDSYPIGVRGDKEFKENLKWLIVDQ